MVRTSSGSGRCSPDASDHGARIYTSISSSVVRITGMAFGWIGFTTAFGSVVRKPQRSALMKPVAGDGSVATSSLITLSHVA